MLKDPACGKRLSRGKAHAIVGHAGVNLFLCCPRCQAEFQRSPQRYARPELGEKVKNIRRLPYRKQRV